MVVGKGKTKTSSKKSSTKTAPHTSKKKKVVRKVVKKAKKESTASGASSTGSFRAKVIQATGSDKCVISGFVDNVHCAHIYPKFKIKDASYEKELREVPRTANEKRREIVNSAVNGILLVGTVHYFFDDGLFGLAPTDHPKKYKIALKGGLSGEEVKRFASLGVEDNRIITLPGVDHRLMKWRHGHFLAGTVRKLKGGASEGDDDESEGEAPGFAEIMKLHAADELEMHRNNTLQPI